MLSTGLGGQRNIEIGEEPGIYSNSQILNLVKWVPFIKRIQKECVGWSFEPAELRYLEQWSEELKVGVVD